MHVAPTVLCPVLCNCRSVMSQLTVCNTAARLPNATVSPLVLSTLSRLLCVDSSFPAVMLQTEDAEASVAVMLPLSAGCWCTRTSLSFK